jgi:hypothetical protein
MATSMGLTTTQSASMATQLVGLAGDLSSFKNIQVEVAETALAGIFTGETESLKRLGVVMTQTNLEQFALSQGITKNIKQMTEAEKVNLRFAFVMEKTKNAQGDFARTSEGSANQLRIFQQGLVQLGTQFGEILLPMFQKAMERLNGILTSITKLSPETKKFALGLGMLVSALGPTVLLIGKASIAVGKLMGSIKKLDKATLILRLKILAITAVIAGLVTAILYVKENFDSFAIFFQNLWNGIKRFVLEAVASISSKIAGLLERVGFDDASAKMKGFIDGVNKSLESIPEGKETNFQSIGEFIDSLTGKAKELISSLTEIGVASEDLPDPSERFDTQSAGRADLPSATNVPQLDLSKATVDTSNFKIGMAETTDEMRQLDHFMKDQLSSTLGTVADSFADLFTGDAGAGDFGSRILSVLGDFAIQFGKLAIGIGTASLSLKKSLFANPPQAIASGLVLVALGKTIKNVTAKFGEGMKEGGIVPSGFNNDTFPALLSSGERVIPKSRSLPSDMGSNLNLSGEFRIKGSDLVLSLAEANYSLDR